MRVASLMTFCSSELIFSSELISVTTFMNSSSCSRIAFIRSNDCALWIASDDWLQSAPDRALAEKALAACELVIVSDLFLTTGKIVSTKDRNGAGKEWDAKVDGTLFEPAAYQPYAQFLRTLLTNTHPPAIPDLLRYPSLADDILPAPSLPQTQAITLVFSVLVVIVNFATDLLLPLIDPRKERPAQPLARAAG